MAGVRAQACSQEYHVRLPNLTETPASLSSTTPSYVQRSLLANPCCFRAMCSLWVGGPKHGKTIGIPPRTGFEPSRADFDERKRRSMGCGLSREGDFHEMTVAPKRRTWAEAPCQFGGDVSVMSGRHSKTGYVGMTQQNYVPLLIDGHRYCQLSRDLLKLIKRSLNVDSVDLTGFAYVLHGN